MPRLAASMLLTLGLLVVPKVSCRGESPTNPRTPSTDADLKFWLQNMVWHHRFTPAEITAATGLDHLAVEQALRRFDIRRESRPRRGADAPLLVLPYPGGRHPRIGFRDGAVHPQRDTKLSVFAPWDDASYIVLDVPEAIWWEPGGRRELLYLAHTHIDTTWTLQGIELKPLEWQPTKTGGWRMERTLPNGVSFGTEAYPGRDAVRLEMWLTNGTSETLRGLRVQNCVLFKGAPEFAEQTNDNKLFAPPYAACRSKEADRWVITAWEPCRRVWGNPPCPCMHSDPQFPDCPPGRTVRLRGWLSFFAGKDVAAEFRRIDATGWREREDPRR